MKVKLTKVFVNDKDKNGNPLVSSKTGKPYKKVAIKTEQHGDKWLSGFANDNDEKLFWKEGQEVEIFVEENGQWLNFKTPGKIDSLEARVKALEDKVFNDGLNF